MDLPNDSYLILIHTKSATERYYRDQHGWVKVSTTGRVFRATAEQVLNHVLPALAGLKRHVTVEVRHSDRGGSLMARQDPPGDGPRPGPPSAAP